MVQPVSAYQGDEPYLFISYSHADTDVVYPLIAWLQEMGQNVWYDEGISPSQEWSEELAAKIEGASHFVFLISPDSMASNYCRGELNYAKELGKPLVTVYLKPTMVTGGMKLLIGTTQAIMAHELKDGDFKAKLLAGVSATGVVTPTTEAGGGRAWLYPVVAIAVAVVLGVGYMLLDLPDDPSSDVPELVVSQVDDKPSIAVLPFDNLSASEDNAYFAAGIHEDILSGLAKIPDLKVISRTSVMQFSDRSESLPEIAAKLGVRHILEGSVRRAGDQVRITVQLIEAAEDQQLWNETYDRSIENVFSVQSEVAEHISGELKVALGLDTFDQIRRNEGVDPAAYDLFLQARNQIRTGSASAIRTGLALLDQAIDIDPGFADAHAHKVLAYFDLASGTEWQAIRADALTSAEAAKRLAPNSGLAALAMGLFYRSEGQPLIAAPHFERAVTLSPQLVETNRYYSQLLFSLGRFEEAFSYRQRLVELDPLSQLAHFELGDVLNRIGRRDEARSQIEKAVRLLPNGQAHNRAAEIYLGLDDLSVFRHLKQAWDLEPGNLDIAFNLVFAFQRLGDFDSSAKWLDAAREISPTHENTFFMRANQYIGTEDFDAYASMMMEWENHNPASFLLANRRGNQANWRSQIAYQEERFDEARLHLEASASHQLDYLRPTMVDNEIGIRTFNTFGVLSYAIRSAQLGRTEEAQKVAERLVAFVEANEDNPDLNAGGNFFGVMGAALLGDIPRANDFAVRADERFGLQLWVLEAYRVHDDVYGVFNGLWDDLTFQRLIAEKTAKDQAVLAKVREEWPELMAETTGSPSA